MKKILLIGLICCLLTSCRLEVDPSILPSPSPQASATPRPTISVEYKEYYQSDSQHIVGVVDLHTSHDRERILKNAVENYGLNIKDEIYNAVEDDVSAGVALVVPKNTDITIKLVGNEKTTEFRQPVICDYQRNDIYAVDKNGVETKLYFDGDSRRVDCCDLLTDKLMFDPALYTDENAFKQKAYAMGYTDEMLEEMQGHLWYTEDEYKTFVLTYGKSRIYRNAHDCSGIDYVYSPDGRYSIRYSAYTWGGSYRGYAAFIEDNETGTTKPLDKNGWFSNYESPVFLDNTHFAVSNRREVNFYDVNNPLKPTNTYRLADSENYEIVSLYNNKRDGNVVIGWAHVPNNSDSVENPTYYYRFTITDPRGNIIKELGSDLGVAFTVTAVASPDFSAYDGRHPDGGLKMKMWKFGSYTLDLETGKTERIPTL